MTFLNMLDQIADTITVSFKIIGTQYHNNLIFVASNKTNLRVQ